MEATATDDIKGLANIKKVVVLMFENRSFDHVFGAFPGVKGLMRDGKINRDYYNLPNPLQPVCDPSNLPVYPTAIDPTVPLNRDFTHDFGDGMMPDLFGPIFMTEPSPTVPSTNSKYYSGYAEGSPLYQVNPGQQTFPATNSGFYTTYNTNVQQGQAALTYFEHDALKVLPKLAKNFVLCDNWYCDMPGHTLPNRAFIHCGTTGYAGIDDTDGNMVGYPSIFEALGRQNWKMYAPGATGGATPLGQLDLRFLNDNVKDLPGAPITEFASDCAAGTLPFYSFIMCWLPHGSYSAWTDTTMHPGSMLQAGENLLAAVYNTLRNSKSWDETLLVVTFDENGGIYDHVMPPTTTPPDKTLVTAPQTNGDCKNSWTLVSQFDFSLLGPRIPALLISPWLEAGIDSHQYQNTSVLRFLIERRNLAPLTDRDRHAPQLESAFHQFGTDTKREDCPDWIAPYATLPSVDPSTNSDAIPYSDGKLSIWNPPPSTEEAAPVCYVQEVLGIYVGPLPGHADSGKAIRQTFATNAEVVSYVHERMAAAERFHASSH